MNIVKNLKKDLSEYLGISIDEVNKNLSEGCVKVSGEWESKYGNSDVSNEEDFYRDCKNYLFDISNYNLETDRIKTYVARILRGMKGGPVLDFGGGTGDLSLSLALLKVPVLYFDICESSRDFLIWRINKYDIKDITVIDSLDDILNYNYRNVAALDVLEHLQTDKFEEYLKIFFRECVRRIFCTLDFSVSKYHPMHLERNKKNILHFEKKCKEQGFVRESDLIFKR